MKSTAFLIVVGVLLVGCAKKKEYKEIYKESHFGKILSQDASDPYVYVPSVENTPMNVTASRPFWLGDQKLVTFKFTENQLEVLEIPTDKRFVKNENNFSPVFKLDIQHKDYRCQEDEFGECSNKEEEVSDRPWQAKPYFKADFSKLTVLETNTLPEQLTNLFTKCFSDRGSVVKKVDMDQDSLNVTVERTLSADIQCADLNTLEDLRNMTFKINYHYSFVKLSKLASPGYQPVIYPFEDQNTFGFFTTTTKKLTADNQTTMGSDQTFMNRWNPAKKEIVYYLNDEFYEEDMAGVKRQTERAIETVNNSFAQAGVDLRIKLEDGRGKIIGDLRNNFLVLVRDPQSSGVIGYGPSIPNPITGEILKGQVVMYYGTIRKLIQRTYDELITEAREKAAAKATEAAELAKSMIEDGKIKGGVSEEMAAKRESALAMQAEMLKIFNITDVKLAGSHQPVRNINNLVAITPKLEAKIQKEIFSHERMIKTVDIKNNDIDALTEELSRNNLYHESMVNWGDAVASAIEDHGLDLTNAKHWNDLTDEEKEVLIEKLMPMVWIPTLVHEFGHNLGLRHNFSGSEDKDNYYTKEEHASLGITRDVTYSSVMDYSYSTVNELPVMGKYDVAALKFGYNRQVEMKDGKIITLTKTLDEMSKDGSLKLVKEYKFCTDEHTSVNPGCNRFDEGSTMKEMALHYVKAYHTNYERRNKRNNRLEFSGTSDADYYIAQRETFQGLRLFFEVYDRIKGMYKSLEDPKAEEWTKVPFLADLRDAAKVALDFYIDVLKTPSVHCAIAKKDTGALVGIMPIENISQDAISCFDEENLGLNPIYTVLAQTGKHFNHARGPELRGDIKADPSQLSIRGIWPDKILAMDYLMKRELKISTFDNYRKSFIDHPEFRDSIIEAVQGLMSDKIEKQVEFVEANGDKFPFEHTFDIGDTHNIVKSFSYGINNGLGIKKASTDLRELAFPLLKKNLITAEDDNRTLSILKRLTVVKVDSLTYVNEEQGTELDIVDGDATNGKYVAFKGSSFAAKLISNHKVKRELDAIKRKLDAASPDPKNPQGRAKLIEIYTNRKGNKLPAEIPAEIKFAYDVEVEKLSDYLLDQYPEEAVVNRLLGIMSM